MEKPKQKRTTLRALTTKLITRVESLISNENPTVDELEELLDELLLKQEQLKEVDSEIQNEITDVKEIDNEIIKCDEYTCNLIKCKGKIKRAINKINPQVSSAELSTTVSEPKINTSRRMYEQPFIKLPLLSIEKFSGDPSDWQRFWDQYDSAIHENSELSNVEKFNYLKTYLIGSAASAIKGFSLTNSNYQSAVDTLKERFGKKSLIINSHFNKLLNLNPVKKSTDVHSLRKLLDTCQTEVRNLIALGISEEQYSTLLCQILIKALPPDIVLEITKKCGDEDEWKISEILNLLRIEVECREKTEYFSSNTSLNEHQAVGQGYKKTLNRNSFSNHHKEISTASGLLNETNNRRYKCLLCKQDNHDLQKCDEFANKSLNEKYDFLRKKAICFQCLRANHRQFSCKHFVKCVKCSKRHYPILCPDTNDSSSNKQSLNENHSKPNLENNDTALANKTCNRHILLQTITLRLRNKDNNKDIIVRGIFDSASEYSYLSKKIIKEIGYSPIGEEEMKHCLFGGVQQTQNHKLYKIFLSNLDRSYLCNFDAYDQEKICTEIPKIEDGTWIRESKEMGILFSDFNYIEDSQNKNNSIDLLIGASVYGKLLTGRVETLSSGLVAVESRLGWTLMGKIPEAHRGENTSLLALSLHLKSERVKDLWDLNILGIRDPIESKNAEDLNDEALEFFNSTVKREQNGRYEVSLPWVCNHPKLPSNRSIAEKRLKSNIQKLKTSGYLEAYQAVFEEWEKEGIIEEISGSDTSDSGHFLPHRPVIRENSTTKIRPVFDGSAKEKHSFSLNDCLAKGPNLIELIPSVLHRFRKGKIGVTADIKKAFLQISLNNNDRNFLKFLWWEDGDSSRLKVYRHCRVVFGINSSPFLLAATLAHLLNQVEGPYKDTAEKLKRSFYVDNCVTSVETKQELDEFIANSQYILASAQFDLRGWLHSPTEQENPNESDNDNVPVLGLQWNIKDDTLSLMYTYDKEENEKQISKRLVLSTVSQIFDPVGFTSPVTLIPKLMLQDTWKMKLNWDSTLPSEMVEKFHKWTEQLNILKEIRIPRTLSPYNLVNGKSSIHTFCDASKTAYATCAFLRTENGDKVSCQLIQARSRVSPLKGATIPRLELLACVIGARLTTSIISELKIENLKVYFWSDSTNALHWIKNDGNWATFVQNRVTEIRRLTNTDHWHHVPGNLNAADLPSRGCTAEALKASQWWEGPQWLRDPPECWPKIDSSPDPDIINLEKRKTVVSAVNTTTEPFELYENTSSYSNMVKITAWIFRFYRNLKSERNNRNLERNLNVEELNSSELIIMGYVQKRSLLNESKKRYSTLQTIVDEKGLIRMQTKISMRKDLENFRYPILLPPDHNVTYRLIYEKHKELNHAGVQIVMSVLREKFWIFRCRKTVRKVLQKCITCKKFTCKPVEVLSAPLPEDRVRDAAVFEVTGVDLCGPLFLKDSKKAWIVLFTCAVYRAIHVEVVMSLSTDSFLQSLRRFIARRGRPQVIFCDNGTNFVSASKQLNSVNWENIKKSANLNKITWKFNPPAAPWWGGFFERMIGLLKGILRKVLGKACLHYEELYTILCDAESVINTRPLTYISEDDKDLVPLTPAMFLQEIKESGVPDIDRVDAKRMKRRFAYRQKVRDDLRKRFRSEYLGQLRDFSKIKRETQIREGDVVLIGDENHKRINWPLGKIETLYPSKDGKIRVVRVKTQSGSYLRPVQRIYPLEVSDDVLASEDILENTPANENNDEGVVPRSRFGRPLKGPKRLYQ